MIMDHVQKCDQPIVVYRAKGYNFTYGCFLIEFSRCYIKSLFDVILFNHFMQVVSVYWKCLSYMAFGK